MFTVPAIFMEPIVLRGITVQAAPEQVQGDFLPW